MVADAIRLKLELSGGFQWSGWLPDADQLIAEVEQTCPDVVLLDIDMPGRDPFEVLEELSRRCNETRVIMHSGHVRNDLIDQAVEAGAWGYVSKNEATSELVAAIKNVMAGRFAFSPEVEAQNRRR